MDLLSGFGSFVAVRGTIDTVSAFLDEFHGRHYLVSAERSSWCLNEAERVLGVRQHFESRFLLLQLPGWVLVASNGRLPTERTLPRAYSSEGFGVGLAAVLSPKTRMFAYMNGQDRRSITYDCEESRRWRYEAFGTPLAAESGVAGLGPDGGLTEVGLRTVVSCVGFELSYDGDESRPGFLRSREPRQDP